MIFLAEPDLSESFRVFLANWGVVVNKGYILDLDSSLPGSPHTLRINRYNPRLHREKVIPRGKPLDVSFMAGAPLCLLFQYQMKFASIASRWN
ncbi:MAG: hypothetical protein Ct9H300mP27_10870 [Chloroflexota bacterium]|nr:MAG: hypothetical protein Ct9H300mP27_10870 [Chloroflexota bacterium]